MLLLISLQASVPPISSSHVLTRWKASVVIPFNFPSPLSHMEFSLKQVRPSPSFRTQHLPLLLLEDKMLLHQLSLALTDPTSSSLVPFIVELSL